jgi:glycosyltransferase involved in cell wall biosynthesis
MQIGIDISQIVYEGTGVGRFTSGLVSAILEHEQKHSWTFFAGTLRRQIPAPVKKQIHAAGHSLVTVPLPPKALGALWNDLHLFPVNLLLPKLEWFITSDWSEPPAKCKKATIVHDLAFKRYPETVDQGILHTQNKRLIHVAKESTVIFVDSKATQEDLVSMYDIEEHRICVNYPGVTTVAASKELRATIRAQHPRPYLITVGKVEPRKNLSRLIQAFTRLNRPDIDLFIVGLQGWDELGPVPEQVKMLGFVPDDQLAALYQESKGFVLASLWEGFGYPVLEAMQLRVPVAVSGTSSLGEIAGGYAHTFNPESTDEITGALRSLLDSDRSKTIAAAGAYADAFTWKRYYKTLIDRLTV